MIVRERDDRRRLSIRGPRSVHGDTARWRAPLLWLVALLVAPQILALGAVSAGDLVPDGAIVEALDAAVASGSITDSGVEHLRTGGRSDRYGECVMLGMGVGAPESYSRFERVATSPNLYACPNMINRLENHAAGGPLTSVHKKRYWNGLSAISRPAIAWFGVDGLRTLSLMALAGGIAALAVSVGRSLGGWAALALLGPLFASGDLLGLVQVFHHPLMLAFGLSGVACLARLAHQDRDWDEIAVAAFAAGSVYSFVDLMNFVPGLWAMSAGVAAACVPSTRDPMTRLGRTLAAGAAWPAGYLSMWIGKWVWAAIATSWSSVAEEIAGQIRFRIGGESSQASGEFAGGLSANIEFWIEQPLAPAVLVVSGLVAVAAILRDALGDRHRLLSAGVAAGAVLVLPPWLLVFNNHNEIHYWFEYRSLPMVLGVVLMALCSRRACGGEATAPSPPAPGHDDRGDRDRSVSSPIRSASGFGATGGPSDWQTDGFWQRVCSPALCVFPILEREP